ncbi:hypothetical protein GCM10010228_09340 [Streptomyces massasporeus]|nr:hypothetical protein GCM10010228_09340 [Streptomyces massasporeus]
MVLVAVLGALASAGTAVKVPAMTTAAPHSAAARFLTESSQDGGMEDREGRRPRRIVPETGPGRTHSVKLMTRLDLRCARMLAMGRRSRVLLEWLEFS